MQTHQYSPRRRSLDGDRMVKAALIGVSSLSVLIVFLIIAFTLANGWTALTELDLIDFLFGDVWKPSEGEYGALPLILGTVLVTFGAMMLAVPIGLASAVFISEVAPSKFRNTIKPVCEILSAIPSVVYGFFGLVVLLPFLKDLFPDQLLFGSSWLAGSIVLGIMALPTVISISEDALHAVPNSYREASQAMGATKWETIVKVVIPAAVSGISAAVIMGMGRAVGETMAVMMVTGNTPVIPDPLWNIFSIVSTLTGTIAGQLPESVAGTLGQSSLFLLGIVLMVMVFMINSVSRHVVRKAKTKGQVVEAPDSKIRMIFGPFITSSSEIINRHKQKIIGALVCIITFTFVSMIVSLFTGTGMSLIAGAIGVAVIAAAKRVSDNTDRNSIQQMAMLVLALCMGLVVLVLVILIGYIVVNGVSVIDWEFLTTAPTNGGTDGGIFPAIVGTLELIIGTALIALPLGILTGTYLAEYSRDTRFTRIIREAIDLLNGTPSIVFGMFGMVFLVIYLGLGYSMVGGWIVLSFMVLPVIIRTTEEAINAVPKDLREASRAMGASKWQTTYKVVIPAAMGGVVTGAILALGRSAGETAPIMMTAAVTFQPSLAGSIFDPVMALPLHLYHMAMDVPGSTDIQYGTACILILIVLVFFGIATAVRRHYDRKVRW